MQRYTIIKHGYIHVIVLNKAKKKLYEYKHKLQRKPKKPSKLQQCKNLEISQTVGENFICLYILKIKCSTLHFTVE